MSRLRPVSFCIGFLLLTAGDAFARPADPAPAEAAPPANSQPNAQPASPASDAPVNGQQPGVIPPGETPPPADTAAPAEKPVEAAPAEEVVGGKKKRSAEETITVTGSRIRRKDLTSSAPITIISRE